MYIHLTVDCFVLKSLPLKKICIRWTSVVQTCAVQGSVVHIPTHTHTHTHTHTYITYSNFVSHLNIPTRIRSSLEIDLKLNYGKASSYTPLQTVLSKGGSFSFFNFYLHWSTVDLQCCACFRYIA